MLTFSQRKAYYETAMLVMLFTIIAVSADAYIAGLSLSGLGRYSLPKILYVSSFTLIMALAFVFMFSYAADEMAVFVLKIISGGILIILGTKNLLSSTDKKMLLDIPVKWNLRELALVGISVAIDASIASVALADNGIYLWLVPIFMFAGHFVFLLLGSRTAGFFGLIGIVNKFSGMFLIILGLSRIL